MYVCDFDTKLHNPDNYRITKTKKNNFITIDIKTARIVPDANVPITLTIINYYVYLNIISDDCNDALLKFMIIMYLIQ